MSTTKRTGRYSTAGDSYYSSDWGNNHAQIPINMARYGMHKHLSGGKLGFLGRIGNSYWDHWNAAVSINLKFKNYTSICFANLDDFRFNSNEKDIRSISRISTKYAFEIAATKAIVKLKRLTTITTEDVDFIEITARTFRHHASKGDGLIGFSSEGDVSIVLNPTDEESLILKEFNTFNILSNVYKGVNTGKGYTFY